MDGPFSKGRLVVMLALMPGNLDVVQVFEVYGSSKGDVTRNCAISPQAL